MGVTRDQRIEFNRREKNDPKAFTGNLSSSDAEV